MPLPVEEVFITNEEIELLRHHLGAFLIEAEVSDIGLTDESDEFVKSEADDLCSLRLVQGDREHFLAVQSTQRDVRNYWDVPRPEITVHTSSPHRIGWSIVDAEGQTVPYIPTNRRYRFNSAIIRIEIYQYTYDDDEGLVHNDIGLKLVVESGEALMIAVDVSIMCWVKVAGSAQGIRNLINEENMQLRLVLE